MTIHPARTIGYHELAWALDYAVQAGLVTESRGPDGLAIYCYSKTTVYERAWTTTSLMARGLILDTLRHRVVATPFPKFFNVGEGDHTIPDLPFEVFEKVDGSLIILFWHQGCWRTATKGSFRSDQALAAANYLEGFDVDQYLEPGYTYLLEWVAPDNRIVVHYDEPELIMLAAYDDLGNELDYRRLGVIANVIGWRTAKRHAFDSVSDLIAHAATLPATEEGFVLRFDNGLRLKVKGDEYRRIHALISRCTPLAMWETMRAGDDLQAIRRDLPEEFWDDFDLIVATLELRAAEIVATTERKAYAVKDLTDKQVGLLESLSHKSLVFSYRKFGDLMKGKARDQIFRMIRPTANKLDGYTPSHAMTRVMEESEAT